MTTKKAKRIIPPIPKKNPNAPVPPTTKKKSSAPVPPPINNATKKKSKPPAPVPPPTKKKSNPSTPVPPPAKKKQDPPTSAPNAAKKRPIETSSDEGLESKRRRDDDLVVKLDLMKDMVDDLQRQVMTLEDQTGRAIEAALDKKLAMASLEADLDLNTTFAEPLAALKAEKDTANYQNVIDMIQKVVELYIGDGITSLLEDETFKDRIFEIIREYVDMALTKRQAQKKQQKQKQ